MARFPASHADLSTPSRLAMVASASQGLDSTRKAHRLAVSGGGYINLATLTSRSAGQAYPRTDLRRECFFKLFAKLSAIDCA
jgi:hypothetical protein